MGLSDKGYARPEFSKGLRPSQKQSLKKICPSVRQSCDPDGRTINPVWGPFVTCETGFSTDETLRKKAASGGALSGFAISLLESQEVDGVIHIKADPSNPLANVTSVSTNAEEVLAAAGSRYAPSSPLDILNTLKGDGRRYAFIGKPCDVSALRSLRKLDSDVADMVPVLISFFCAGVPSLHSSQDILEKLDVLPDRVLRFQHRGEGWPGLATAVLDNGKQHTMSYSQSWGNILSKTVQQRCKLCADGSGVFADVVFADAWETDAQGYPSFDDRPGQSLILCRTDLGRRLVDAAVAAGHLIAAPYEVNELTRIQPGQTRRRRVLAARLAALRVLGRPVPQYRGMGVWTMARQASFTEILRNFGGMLRRALRPSVKEEGGQC